MPLSKIVAKSIKDDTITTDQIADNSVHGRRNFIINGAMQVAQRGTSETSVTTSGYRNACDRFRCNGNNGTWTISQDTNAPDGFSNSFKMLLTATETISSTSYWAVEQRIEGQNLQGLAYGTSSAKTVTVSFYVKSNVTGTYCLNLYQDDGAKNFPKTYTIDSAGTWERKTISFGGDTSTALDNDNASSLRTIFLVVAGSGYNSGTPGSKGAYADATFAAGHTAQIDAVNDYWQITGLQLEVGDKATPFEHRSYGEELALCHRYFEKVYLNSYSCMLSAENSQQAKGGVIRFSEKRANPSITFPTIGTGSNQLAYTEKTGSYVTQGSTFRSTQTKTQMSIFNNYADGFSGMDAGENIMLYVNGNCEIDVKAEL